MSIHEGIIKAVGNAVHMAEIVPSLSIIHLLLQQSRMNILGAADFIAGS
jgi:hypothetical protein